MTTRSGEGRRGEVQGVSKHNRKARSIIELVSISIKNGQGGPYMIEK